MIRSEDKPPWVIVAPGFHAGAGMERANLELARYLAGRGTSLELVGHRVDEEIAAERSVTAHRVPRPSASFLLGERRLDRRGQAVVGSTAGARVVVNGGNCGCFDINWVHFVHHAWTPTHAGAPLWFRAKSGLLSRQARADELSRIPRARLVLANSDATRRFLIELLGVRPEVVHTVYLGSDPSWGPAGEEERGEARAWLGIEPDRPLVVFVGALGYDTRKGFDTLLTAWRALCSESDWDAELVVAGGGRGLDRWREEIRVQGLAGRVRLLGHTSRVDALLAAADLLVSPARYEPYGLNVQEALCRGVPALVSGTAGIAERYPSDLRELILADPEDDRELASQLRSWRSAMSAWKARVAPLGETLRARSWTEMARDIVALAERDEMVSETTPMSNVVG